MGIKIDNNKQEDIDFFAKKEPSSFLQDSATGFKESVEGVAGGFLSGIPSALGNTLGFGLDVVSGLPGASKTVGEDIRQKGRKDTENMAKMLGVDTESTSAQIGKTGIELLGAGKMKLPLKVVEAVKAGKISTQVAKLMSKYGGAFAKKFPTIASSLKTGINWGKEGAKFGIVSEGDAEGVSDFASITGLLGIAGGAIGKGFQKIAPAISTRLQLSDLITANKLNIVGKKLEQVGEKLPSNISSPEKAANWMIDRGVKGSESQMITKLDSHFNKADFLFKNILEGIKGKFTNKKVEQGIRELIKQVEGVAGKEKDLKNWKKMLDKYEAKGLSLTDINRVKKGMDKEFGIFTIAGDVKAATQKEGLGNIRKDIKTFIENTSTKLGGGDVKMLNNEKAISKTLIDGIKTKDASTATRDLMFHLAANPLAGGILGAASAIAGGRDPSQSLGYAIGGGITAGVLGSRRIKTNLAFVIRNLSKSEKEKIAKFEWSKYLPDDLKNLLTK